MGEVVELKPAPLVEDHEFVVDLARFRDRRKYRFDEATWLALGDDDELIRKVEEESVRRVRDGSCKRERAQALIVKGPGFLDSIATDPAASPRHRVDAIKTLDGMAANGPESAPASADRFQITIVINDDVLHFDKSITPDVAPHHIDDTPQEEWLPIGHYVLLQARPVK
jgi:hypothetical protein